jgi:amidase
MGRSVADVAALFTAMVGSDPEDAATAEADAHKQDYSAAIAGASLRGKRLGVLRLAHPLARPLEQVFDAAIAALRAAGAEIVEIRNFDEPPGLGELEHLVLITDFKADLNAYLATTPPSVKTRSLAGVIAFNRAEPRELSLFGQETFEAAEKTRGLDDPLYRAARAQSQRMAAEAIDRPLREHRLDALVVPTIGPAWRTDTVRGDVPIEESATLPAVSGYPHLTVPMGAVGGLPVGLSFIGAAWSDAQLLALGAAYEKATHMRRPPAYLPSAESLPAVAADLAPAP